MHRRARRSAQPLGRMRTVPATLAASSVVTLGLFAMGVINSKNSHDGVVGILVSLVAIYLLTSFVIASIAFPFRYLARRWNFARGWMVVAIGSTFGLLIGAATQYILTQVPALKDDRHIPFLVIYIELGLVGAAGGMAFWALAKQEMRPNNSLERTREG
jgi:hypothetical protein